MASAQDRHAVGDRPNLVQLVRDEDDRASVVGHRTNRPEQLSRLLRRQDRGRLVEDQHARILVEGFQDLDALLLSQGQLPDACARFDGEPVSLRHLGDAPLDRPGVQQERPADVTVITEHDVLGDAERLHESKMLVHHGDARIERVAWGVELDRLTPQADLAAVRPVEPRQDVGQRRLAGAVLAQQCVHLARGRLEVDVFVRDDGGESFRDPPHRDGRRRWGGLRLPTGTISPWRYRSRL